MHATIELRLLTLPWMDEAVAFSPRLRAVAVYVDDVGFESSGAVASVPRVIISAARAVTKPPEKVGVAFSPAKNTVVTSTPAVVERLFCNLRRVHVFAAREAPLPWQCEG